MIQQSIKYRDFIREKVVFLTLCLLTLVVSLTAHAGPAPLPLTLSSTTVAPGATLAITGQPVAGWKSSGAFAMIGGQRVALSYPAKTTAQFIVPTLAEGAFTLQILVSGNSKQPTVLFSQALTVNSPGPDISVFTNKGDPEFLRIKTVDGNIVDYFGERDENGLPTQLTSVRVQTANGDIVVIFFDELGRPIKFIAPNGVTIKFLYLSETQVLATAIMPDGSQVNAPITIPEQTADTLSTSRSSLSAHAASADCNGIPLLVNVTCGGSPVNTANVALTVTKLQNNSDAPEFNSPLPAVRVGDGQYKVCLPGPDPDAGARAQEQCERISSFIDNACLLNQPPGLDTSLIATACPLLELAAISTLNPYVAALAAACPVVAVSVEILCGVVPAILDGQEGVFDGICSTRAYDVNREIANTAYSIFPTVSGVPGVDQVTGQIQFVTLGGVGPVAPFTVDLTAASNGHCGEKRLRAVLTWNNYDTDVDLHLTDSQGNRTYYASPTGVPNSRLDIDDVDGFGPENIYLDPMDANTTYTVGVHYFSDHDNGPTTAQVLVFLDDELVTSFSTTLSSGQFATVGTYNSGPVISAASSIGQPEQTFNLPTNLPVKSAARATAREAGLTSTTSTVGLSSMEVNVKTSEVTLAFYNALNKDIALDSSHYSVLVNGGGVAPRAVSCKGNIVTLKLPKDSLHPDDSVVVFWNELLDANGQKFSGQFGPVYARK